MLKKRCFSLASLAAKERDVMFYFRTRPPVSSTIDALFSLYDSYSKALFDSWLLRDNSHIRGRKLLREWLSTEQRAQFDLHDCFEVIGCQTGKKYRIRYGHYSNIEELDANGRPVSGWCFVPAGNLAAGDVMLAQKIALETSERATLAIANPFPILHSETP
jgi:hypothetical protein